MKKKLIVFSCCAILFFLFVCGINMFYACLFPIEYETEVADASEAFGVDKATIYSIINIESHFNKNAVSNKGAVGLMQLLPSTAKEFARKLQLEEYDLENPRDNISIGTAYFSYLKNKFKDEKLALCAYNAGSANVIVWMKKYSADGVKLDKIPFPETENYIKKFEQNYKFYSKKV